MCVRYNRLDRQTDRQTDRQDKSALLTHTTKDIKKVADHPSAAKEFSFAADGWFFVA